MNLTINKLNGYIINNNIYSIYNHNFIKCFFFVFNVKKIIFVFK